MATRPLRAASPCPCALPRQHQTEVRSKLWSAIACRFAVFPAGKIVGEPCNCTVQSHWRLRETKLRTRQSWQQSSAVPRYPFNRVFLLQPVLDVKEQYLANYVINFVAVEGPLILGKCENICNDHQGRRRLIAGCSGASSEAAWLRLRIGRCLYVGHASR